MAKIVLNPQPYQAAAMTDFTTPIVGVSGGKRSGKTRLITCEKAIVFTSLHPGHTIVIASPTYGMTRRNILPVMRELRDRMGLVIEGLDVKSPSELKIKWGNKVSTIVLDVTIENFGRMNGMSLAGVFVDEIDKANIQDAELFLEEAQIRLSKPYPGRVAQLNVTGAPELNGYMAEFFIEKAGPDRVLHKWSMMQNMALSDEYKALQQANIPPKKQPGWIHGEFMYNNEGLVYDEYNPVIPIDNDWATCNHTDLSLDHLLPNEDVWVTWDINDGGCAVLIAARRGPHILVLQEWVKMESTKHVLERVAKMPWADRAVLTCDPASTQVLPYIKDAKAYGIRNQIMSAAPRVQWRVTAVNNRFGTGSTLQNDGIVRRHLLINTKTCKTLNKCLMRQQYVRVGDENIPDKKMWLEEAGTDISGPIDALGYLTYLHFPYNPKAPGAQVRLR